MCLKKLFPGGNNSATMLLPKPNGLVPIDQKTIAAVLAKIAPTCTILYGDSIYSTTSIDELRRFLKDDKTNEYRYISEFYDCDDFSFRLMGQIHCVEWGALPFGILWTVIQNGTDRSKWVKHAVNCYIDKDLVFWIVEPQTDQVFSTPGNWKPYFIII